MTIGVSGIAIYFGNIAGVPILIGNVVVTSALIGVAFAKLVNWRRETDFEDLQRRGYIIRYQNKEAFEFRFTEKYYELNSSERQKIYQSRFIFLNTSSPFP